MKVEEGAFDGAAPVDKEAPNFEVSGKLLEDTNTFNGVIVKYSEPPEARKPKRRWRFYVFKGDESLPTLHIHRQSAFLEIIERFFDLLKSKKSSVLVLVGKSFLVVFRNLPNISPILSWRGDLV